MQLPNEFTLSMFSDGVLELLTLPSLAEKERYLLDLIEKEAGKHESIVRALAIDSDAVVPDDVALMTIVRV